MAIYWNVQERAERRGWLNAHQLALGAGISYPSAWRILKGEPVERIDVRTLEGLARAFKLESPWSLLEHRPGERAKSK
jgi:hypothetical protein